MFLTLPDVLEPAAVSALREAVATAQWEDGLATTGGAGRGRKHNEQVAAGESRLAAWQELVLRALRRHPMMQFLVLPKRFMAPVFNRYEPGMEYRDHVDFPLLGGGDTRMRADLSLTLFLSAPESYEGGELVIEAGSGERRIKLPAGQAYVYPASTLHRVEPVRSGSRLAAVTTIQSHIRGESERALLADMLTLWRRIEDLAPASDEQRLAAKIHHNLVRMWAD
ncbi:MAG TPA: Fe2+-dependent dioxygenase [Gammaproteobacteria bacterium]|nr:Fe2+-dependent dioxygenase [Gammaproteobacteria bacterium]